MVSLRVVAAVVRRVKESHRHFLLRQQTLRISNLVRVVGELPPVASSGQAVVARCKIPPRSLRSVLHIYSGGPTINRRVSHGVSTYKLLGNENSIPMAVEGNLPYGYENLEGSRGSHVQWS